jgi:hypothetical protein
MDDDSIDTVISHIDMGYLVTLAVDQGDEGAMVNLGNPYDAGHGMVQDYERANALYREAIGVDNNTDALFNLGESYSQGEESGAVTALSFWQRAADLEHPVSQWNVGLAGRLRK